MVILFIILVTLYALWCRLDRYNPVDYGHKHFNCLMGLNQILCRKFHGMGDFWLDIPEKGGVILAANHTSSLDPAVLVAACKRPVRFLATNHYYQKPFMNRIFSIAGCIPVYRDKDNTIALQKAVEALKNGEVIGIFPFGGFHTPLDEEPRLRTGVAVLSKLANVPVVPVYIGGVVTRSFKKIISSIFFIRSRLKVKQYNITQCDSDDFKEMQSYLYNILSNHKNYNKFTDKPIEINPVHSEL